MAYSVVDPQDNDGVANISSDSMRLRRDGYCPCLDLSELKQQQNFKWVRLSCAVCAVEEASRRALKIKTPRMFSIKQQGIDYCEQCKLPAHNTLSNTEIRKLEGDENHTCFEIMHLQSNEDLRYKYDDNGVGRRRLWTYHPLYRAVKYLLKEQLPRQSSRIRSTRGQREVTLPPRPPLPRLRTRPNRTHKLPSRDSIGTDSAATTITETGSNNDQRPIDVVLTEL